MKYVFTIIYFLLLVSNTVAQSSLNDLDVCGMIEIKKIEQININRILRQDTIITLDIKTMNTIDGISVSGTNILSSDSSFIQIILKTSNGYQYLMFESSIIYDNIGINNFVSRMDETFCLNNISNFSIIVYIKNAELKLNRFDCFQIRNEGVKKRIKMKRQLISEIHNKKIEQVRKYIKKNNMIWHASTTHLSTMPYRYKKDFFGENNNSYGFEFYAGGIFQVKPNKETPTPLKSTTSSSYADKFDWRDRHNQNWMTSAKCQAGCYLNNSIDCSYQNHSWNTDSLDCVNAGGEYREPGTCWSFAAIGGIESVVNLYFNQQLNLDLSEQEMVIYYGDTTDNLRSFHTYPMNKIVSEGVVDENCCPYKAIKGTLSDICSSPDERIQASGYYQVCGYSPAPDEIKSALISQGPLPCKMKGWSHSVTIVGWSTIKENDYIDFIGTISDTSSYIGQEYWILKNSNPTWAYIYMIGCPNYVYAYETPLSSLNYNTSDIMCIDNDNDGYYNWGIGDKPSTCPTCCPDQEDGNDSNPNYGPMDEYGNLTAISESYQYTSNEVTSTETWTSDLSTCGDVVVSASGSLTIIGANISLEGNNIFNVKQGGELLISEGTIQ